MILLPGRQQCSLSLSYSCFPLSVYIPQLNTRTLYSAKASSQLSISAESSQTSSCVSCFAFSVAFDAPGNVGPIRLVDMSLLNRFQQFRINIDVSNFVRSTGIADSIHNVLFGGMVASVEWVDAAQ